MRKGRLRNCHSIRLRQFPIGVILGLIFLFCVCVCASVSVFLFLHSSSLPPSCSPLCPARMEESHFNSSPYFWPAVPTVSGQVRFLSFNPFCRCCFTLEVCEWCMFLLLFLLSQLLEEAVLQYSKSCSSHLFRLTTPCLLTRWRSSYCPQRRAAALLPPTTLPCWQCPPQWPFPLALQWTLTPSRSSWHHTAKPLWLRTSPWCQCSLLGSWQQVGNSATGGCQDVCSAGFWGILLGL